MNESLTEISDPDLRWFIKIGLEIVDFFPLSFQILQVEHFYHGKIYFC